MGKVSHLNLRDDEPTALPHGRGLQGRTHGRVGAYPHRLRGSPRGVPERPWRMLPKTYHSN